jgi:N-acetylmuramoyl-L-alanine amidase
MRLLGFLLVVLWAWPLAAAELPWLMIEKTPYLTLADWEKQTGFHSFPDLRSGRILLERKGRPDILLLLGSPYALVGARFMAIPEAPFRKGSTIVLSLESAERVFTPALASEEKAAFAAAVKEAKGRIESKTCLHQRPVQRIFLDPGHGGSDEGTKFDGVREKDIVLKFARLAGDELRRRGFEVSFSRTRDVFLPLDIRSKLAKEWKADLFISIHVNSSPAPSARGTETYILSQDATDAEARKLALIENSIASEAKEQPSAVQDILWDMEQTAYLQDSAYLASDLQGALVAHAHDLVQRKTGSGDWKNRGVRQAPFFVLNRAAMPAVLVEIGYLSNSHDRKLMQDKFFQESLAKALAEGVKKYKESCRLNP